MVSLVADMFEYSGPLDLTEYKVRRTELGESGGEETLALTLHGDGIFTK